MAEIDAVRIDESSGSPQIVLPEGVLRADWAPEPAPIEVIDGQHRLWAFDEPGPQSDFELPIVAFVDLDISWQAYLFWTINITPRRINASLAFDLIPLLRTEEWLDRFAGHAIYRQARSQELVEALWSTPASPWFQRVNMLGESAKQREDRRPMVSQAAWVRALMTTFVRKWESNDQRIGGLFGAPVGRHETVLPWTRTQQAAVLICLMDEFRQAVQRPWSWAEAIRHRPTPESDDPAFYGPDSLIPTDQGVRGFLAAANDILFVEASSYDFDAWVSQSQQSSVESGPIDIELASLRKSGVGQKLVDLGAALARYDWRTSTAPGVSRALAEHKRTFRGSSGYRLFRLGLLETLASDTGWVGSSAAEALSRLVNK